MHFDPNPAIEKHTGPACSLDDLWKAGSPPQPDLTFALSSRSLANGALLRLFPADTPEYAAEPPWVQEHLLDAGRCYRILYEVEATTVTEGYIEIEPRLGRLPFVYASSVAATTAANRNTARVAVRFLADARTKPLTLALRYKGTPARELRGSLQVWGLEPTADCSDG